MNESPHPDPRRAGTKTPLPARPGRGDHDPATVTPISTIGSSVAVWLMVCVIATVGMSLTAAHAPARIRLIGLFSIAFGAMIGWLMVLLANKLESNPPRPLIGLFAAILTLGGLIGYTLEAIRIEDSVQTKSANDEMALRLLNQMKASGGKVETPDMSAMARYRGYLARRIKQLGDLQSPWPEVVWLVELFAGTAAGIWMSNYCWSNLSNTTNDPDSVTT